MSKRVAGLLICAVLLFGAAPAHARKTVGKRLLPIALVLNGTKLAVNPPPVFYKYHLLVPVRRSLTALGLEFEKQGRYVRTYAGAKTVEIAIGSKMAHVDGEPVIMDAAPVEIKNVLYAPLRFFTDALGAQALFDRQTNSVEIIAALIGRSGDGVSTTGGETQLMGTVTSIDLNSYPATLTVSYDDASARTVTISPTVSVLVQDVNTGTSNPSNLAQVHVGDYADLDLSRQGSVKRIVDAFGSRVGTVAAVAAGEVVLSDGHVIAPTRTTTITLNGSNVGLDGIAVGDSVMVRYNIDSSEPLQIIATGKAQVAPAVATASAISDLQVGPPGPLRAGDVLTVTMRGTPGGVAEYDIGPYVVGLSMTQAQPGLYTGSYKIPRGVNFAGAPILGRLNVRGAQAPEFISPSLVTVSTQPPEIVDFAPEMGAVVNDTRPSIYATFSPGVVEVNPSSATINLNGHDVTSSAMRTSRFIQYTPGIDYPPGPMHVTVRVRDMAGNTASKSWTFYIAGR